MIPPILGIFGAIAVVSLLIFVFSPKDKPEVDDELEGELDPEVADQISDLVSRKVKEGFEPREEIIEAVIEIVQDEFEIWDLAHHVTKAVDLEIGEQNSKQSTWPSTTDCDRLDAAFRSLKEKRIVARQNFSCCQTCGHSEIGDEMNEFSDSNKPIGYTFFHQQDTESVVESGTLYLAYGTFDDDTEDAITVGGKIRTALTDQGLSVDWDGTVHQRICVTDIDWQKRR